MVRFISFPYPLVNTTLQRVKKSYSCLLAGSSSAAFCPSKINYREAIDYFTKEAPFHFQIEEGGYQAMNGLPLPNQ